MAKKAVFRFLQNILYSLFKELSKGVTPIWLSNISHILAKSYFFSADYVLSLYKFVFLKSGEVLGLAFACLMAGKIRA